MTRALLTVLLLLAAALPFEAQKIGQNAPAVSDTPNTFSTSSQLVIETVNVKDKSGKPLEGLTAKDFTVTEDGAEQGIRFFEYQKVSETADPEPAIRATAQPLKKLPEAQITSEKPGDLRYQNRRLLVLYFDGNAASGPIARHLSRGEVRSYADDPSRSLGADEIRRRRRSSDVGFHSRSRAPDEHP